MADEFVPQNAINVGFEKPMVDPGEAPAERPIETNELVSASEDLAARRRAELEPAELEYKDDSGVGRRDINETVTPKRAARDLAAARDSVQAERERQADEINALTVDLVRNERKTGVPIEQQLAQAEAAQQQPTPAPATPAPPATAEQTPQLPPGVDPEVAKALTENPKLRQALEVEVGRIQQVERTFLDGLKANAQVTAAAFFASYPELQGLNGDQIPGAIALLRQQNPARAQAIVDHIGRVKAVRDSWAQAEMVEHQRATQQYREQWRNFTAKEDAAFIKAAPEMNDPDTAQKISRQSVETLRAVGFSDRDVERAWTGEASISLRDSRAQILLLKAAKFDAAQAAMRGAAARTIPPVQKPGVTSNYANFSDNQVEDLSRRLAQTGSYKDAARLLAARRGNKGR